MNHGEPTEQVITTLKQKLSDRALAHVVAEGSSDTGTDEAYSFVMTGPTRAEVEKYQQEMLEANKEKNELEKQRKVLDATEKAMLAQIHWPDRPTVQAVFEKHPTMPFQFIDTYNGMAGDSFKVRAKKL